MLPVTSDLSRRYLLNFVGILVISIVADVSWEKTKNRCGHLIQGYANGCSQRAEIGIDPWTAALSGLEHAYYDSVTVDDAHSV